MQSGSIILYNDDITCLETFLKKEISFGYQNQNKGVITLINENYKIFDSGYETNIIILRIKEERIYIDIYSGGGEKSGILSFGSELDFILETKQLILDYAYKNGFSTE